MVPKQFANRNLRQCIRTLISAYMCRYLFPKHRLSFRYFASMILYPEALYMSHFFHIRCNGGWSRNLDLHGWWKWKCARTSAIPAAENGGTCNLLWYFWQWTSSKAVQQYVTWCHNGCPIRSHEYGRKVSGELMHWLSHVAINLCHCTPMHRFGLDAKILASIINTSSGRCWSSVVNQPVPNVLETAPSGRDYQVCNNALLSGNVSIRFLRHLWFCLSKMKQLLFPFLFHFL